MNNKAFALTTKFLNVHWMVVIYQSSIVIITSYLFYLYKYYSLLYSKSTVLHHPLKMTTITRNNNINNESLIVCNNAEKHCWNEWNLTQRQLQTTRRRHLFCGLKHWDFRLLPMRIATLVAILALVTVYSGSTANCACHGKRPTAIAGHDIRLDLFWDNFRTKAFILMIKWFI